MHILKGYFKIHRFTVASTKLNHSKYMQQTCTCPQKKKRGKKWNDLCNEFTRLEIGFQLAGLASSAIYIMHNRAHHRISISSSSLEAGNRHRCIEKNARGLVFSPGVPLIVLGDGCSTKGDDTCAKVKMYGLASAWADSPERDIAKKRFS